MATDSRGAIDTVYLLQASIARGSFAVMTPLCVASSAERLEVIFKTWLARNRERYGGRYEIVPVPVAD